MRRESSERRKLLDVPSDSDGVLDLIEEGALAEVDTLVEGGNEVAEEEGCEEGEESGDGSADGHPVRVDDVHDEINDAVCLNAVHI